MNAVQNHAFGQLLVAWHRREDARGNSYEVQQLAHARHELDTARAHMRSSLSIPR